MGQSHCNVMLDTFLRIRFATTSQKINGQEKKKEKKMRKPGPDAKECKIPPDNAVPLPQKSYSKKTNTNQKKNLETKSLSYVVEVLATLLPEFPQLLNTRTPDAEALFTASCTIPWFTNLFFFSPKNFQFFHNRAPQLTMEQFGHPETQIL